MLTEKQLKALYQTDYVEAFTNKSSKYRLERLTRYFNLKPTDKIADFACGSGFMLPLLYRRVNEYVGVDFSPEFISKANQLKTSINAENASFECADIFAFCKTHPKSFDAAFAMDFSEHVYDEQWLEILSAIHNSLKPGGKLYLHTPNLDFIVEKMKQRNFILKQFPEHIAVRNISDNKRLIEKAGFTITKLLPLPHYNVLRFLHPVSYLPIIGKWFKARIFIEAVK